LSYSGNRLVIESCEFAMNASGHDLIHLEIREPLAQGSRIARSSFSGNQVSGLLTYFGAFLPDPLPIADCSFVENAAVSTLIRGPFDVSNSSFARNTCETLATDAAFRSSSLLGNTSSAHWLASSSRFTNSILVGNAGRMNRTTVIGCTLLANPLLEVSTPVRNSIVRGNDAPHGRVLLSPPLYTNTDADLRVTNPTNINADPLFIRNPHPGPDQTWGTQDDDYGDLRLQPTSPCIDAADSTAFDDATTTDLAGHPRFTDDPNTPDTGLPDPARARPVADMGAHEFQPATTPPPLCDLNADNQITVQDLLTFINQWTTADPAADLDNDGTVDVLDLLTFIDCFTTSR
jgi:hypothetical protein